MKTFSPTLEQFDTIVSNAGKTNQEKRDEAVTKAHGQAWLVSNIWFSRTDTNLKLINNWLENKGIKYPIYADFAEAAEQLVNTGLLAFDEIERVKHLDGNGPRTFKGVFTKRTHESLESLIAQETDAALRTVQAPSDLDEAFNSLPTDQALQMLKDGEKRHQAALDGQVSQQNADSWLTLNPQYRDDTANGKLMREQLLLNGVINRPATIEDYEIANRQLVKAGLIRQNPAALRKQQDAEVTARAKRAVETPGSVFDTTSEADMYNLPMEELRRRAAGNYTGSNRQ